MNKAFSARLALPIFASLSFCSPAFAQYLSVEWGSSPSSFSSTFTIQAPDDVLSEAASTGYTTDIQAELATIFGSVSNIPGSLGSFLETTQNSSPQAGWVLNGGTAGIAVISKNQTLADPFVSFSTSFANPNPGGGAFSETFYSTFPAEAFTGANGDASFGVTLTDGTANRSGVSEKGTETATLINTTTNASETVNTLTNNAAATNGATIVSPASNTFLDASAIGLYDELAVNVAGTYTSGAQVGVSGRVDVTSAPEPATWAALLAAGLASLVFRLRRSISLN